MKNYKILLFAFTIILNQKGFSQTTPDFTPMIEVDGFTFPSTNPPTSRDFLINVSEILNKPSNGQIVLKLTKSSTFNPTFISTTTNSNVNGGTPVDNNLWEFSSNALFGTIKLKQGVVFPAYGIQNISGTFTTSLNAPAQTIQPITVTILNGSGGDSVDTNNTHALKLRIQ